MREIQSRGKYIFWFKFLLTCFENLGLEYPLKIMIIFL